ncbi:Nucleotidyltransferase [Salix suchowensis]|nr:Nucleotidyltransferase [Salix suchowensis]
MLEGGIGMLIGTQIDAVRSASMIESTKTETRGGTKQEGLRTTPSHSRRLDERCRLGCMMHGEVEAFVKWASPTHEEDEMRALVVSQITKAVTSAYHDAQVHPFGSFATKLYLPLGRVQDYVLRDLAHVIKRARIADQATIISRARVPIIKFTSIHGSFHVDVSIGQVGGLKSVEIVNNFLNTMSLHSSGMALRALVLIAKAFLSQRNMNEVFTGGLGSYSIVCLAISFLQMHPKIRRGEIDPDKNLGVLVVEFFELYGCYFYYEEVGISVREGGRIIVRCGGLAGLLQ